MAAAEQRKQFSVRLKADDCDLLSTESQAAGLEPAVAARQILELFIQRLREGEDYVGVLHAMNQAMKAGGRREH